MRKQFAVFLVRWALNAVGLWISIRLFGNGYSDAEVDSGILVFIVAGLIFSIVNTVVRPLAIILSLPAILLTLGLFTLLVNGFMVYISLLLTPVLSMTFFNSILTGMVLSLINYIVSSAIELRYEKAQEALER